MADEGAGVRPAAWYGVIQSAAHAHATTADVWRAIHEYSAQRGLTEPPGLWSEVNRMRSLAGSLVSSGSRLGRSSEDTPITGKMIGREIYSRSASDQSITGPAYHVHYQLDYVKGGAEESAWYRLSYGYDLPATVGDLMADVEAMAGDLAESYGVELTGIGAVEIGAW